MTNHDEYFIECRSSNKEKTLKKHYIKNRQIQDYFQKLTSTFYTHRFLPIKHHKTSTTSPPYSINMKNQNNLYLLMQQDDNLFVPDDEEMSSFCDRHKSRNSLLTLNNIKINSKISHKIAKKNDNQQLQDLLEADTLIYNTSNSNINTQKKHLYNDLSFFSRDYTQDLTNQEGYNQMMSKIHFQRSRNRELNHELNRMKEEMTQKYLSDLMQEFKYLSDQNKRLRQVYKKEAGGGYKPIAQKNQPKKQEQLHKNNSLFNFQTGSQTPKNSLKNGRKSITALSMANQQTNQGNFNSYKANMTKNNFYVGKGTQNFGQTRKMDTQRPSIKTQISQSSFNSDYNYENKDPIQKRHKRRESQLTQRKDHPEKQNFGDDFLLIMDDCDELLFQNELAGRMSQPSRMSKQRYVKQVHQNQLRDSQQSAKKVNHKKKGFFQSVERNSLEFSLNGFESKLQPANTKNIFIQFLQNLLLEERILYIEMTQQINEKTIEEEKDFIEPSYKNIKLIQQLQKEIMAKNLKLRQLQEVINVFKSQIQQIVGTDIKMINELMVDLLSVKGKYLEMQQKVNGISGLKREIEIKQKIKQDTLLEIKQRIEKRKKQALQKQQLIEELEENFEVFPIPQSIKTLFDLLNIKMPEKSRPIHYLNQIKNLPKNKQLFQPIDSKKRNTCNMKIKEIIDQIREGRKKFNEVIKLYQSRIIKLQQKIQRYKNQKHQGRVKE